MWPPEDEAAWDRQATQVRADLQGWRAAHPRATLREIEQEVDRRLAAARAGPTAPPPPCPACEDPLIWEGTRTRRLRTTHDEVIALPRRYARCPTCGTGLFPPG